MDWGTAFAIYWAVGLVLCIAMEVSGQNQVASSGEGVASVIFGPVIWGPFLVCCLLYGIYRSLRGLDKVNAVKVNQHEKKGERRTMVSLKSLS